MFHPGPWQVRKETGQDFVVVVETRGGAGICAVMDEEDADQNIQNAALIAVAPEMYDALVDLAAYLGDPGRYDDRAPLRDRVEALIQRAAGIRKA